MKEYRDVDATIISSEDIINTVIEAEDKHDPSACIKIAEWYKMGIIFEQSDVKYINMLKKAYEYASDHGNILRIMKDCYDDMRNGGIQGVIASISVDEWKAASILGEAAYNLGLYYSNFFTVEKLRIAEDYFRESMWCFFDAKKQLKETTRRIMILQHITEDSALSSGITALKQTFFRNFSRDRFDNYPIKTYNFVYTKIREEFKEKNWNKLQSETQVYILTALFTFSCYIGAGQDNYKNLDFASCISLLTRGLEYEIKLRFYKGYLSYLKKHYYNPGLYIKHNMLNSSDATNKRSAILYRNRGGILYYKDYEKNHHSYTLGSFAISIGFKNTNRGDNVQVDATFLDYCENDLMENGWGKNQIKSWLHDICDQIEKLRIIRNNASHGGKVLTETDAEYVFDQMIFTQKILEKIVVACRY